MIGCRGISGPSSLQISNPLFPDRFGFVSDDGCWRILSKKLSTKDRKEKHSQVFFFILRESHFRSLSSMTFLFGRCGVTVRMLTLERGHWFDTTIFRILCHENLPLNLPDLCSFGGLVRNFDIGKKCCILYNIGALSVGLNNSRTSIVEKTHRKI